MRITITVGAAVASLALGVPAAQAWGPEGHALIADMAQAHLTGPAKAEVARLLAGDQPAAQSMDAVSSWADAYRADHHPETGPFHFVDIPLSAPAYDEDRDCHFDQNDNRVPQTTCVVAKLSEQVQVLADRSQKDDARLAALKWVIHLVGDVHQPLHAENKADRGGNDVKLSYNGDDKTNLHAVWDGGIIEQHYGWKLGPNYTFDHAAVATAATAMDAQISADQRKAWALRSGDLRNDVIQWANESHALAPAIYLAVPMSESTDWQSSYQDAFWPEVSTQLQRASVRLASVLNSAFGQDERCPAVQNVAFYGGPYVGTEDKLSPDDFARDEFCAREFLRTRHPGRFVTVFGSSRIGEANHEPDAGIASANDRLYAGIRAFANKWTLNHGTQFPILTGAGPGLMEAASRGASDAHGPSIGYTTYYGGNQDPAKAFWQYKTADGSAQPIITDGLIFTSVAVRESSMIAHSAAIVIAPGGSGTEWEIFQTVETLKSNELSPVPVFLFGKSDVHWKSLNQLVDDMVARGVITHKEFYDRVVPVENADDLYSKVEAALSK
jgi:predicted Rossmann-fold nucleotide-binding protein